MPLFAKRVSASLLVPMSASTSRTPAARAKWRTFSKTSACIAGSDLDVAKTGWACPVAGSHHLLGLALAAVGNTPQCPMLSPGDRFARIPEFGRDTAVRGVLEHAYAFPFPNLPSDFATELEVI